MESGSRRTAVIFIGGDAPAPQALFAVDPHIVIAADSGYAHARTVGIEVDVLIGDLDSITDEHREHASTTDVQVVEAPRDKDHTDTELAINWAVASGYGHLHLVYGGGDRFDHHLGAVQSLGNPLLKDTKITASIGEAFVHVLHGPATVEITTDVGATVGLVPIGGDATGVTTTGLKWPLNDEKLSAWSSRGVSNVATATEISVALGSGVLFVIIHTEVNK